jgi:hypothetical protein
MAIDHVALKTELQTDPGSLGYAAHITAGNDSALAELLNRTRAAINIDRDVIPTREIFEAIVPAEWGLTSPIERERVSMILSLGEVDMRGTNTRAALGGAFGAGTTTRANFQALQQRRGSRAEMLFGAGERVSHVDVGIALRQTP